MSYCGATTQGNPTEVRDGSSVSAPKEELIVREFVKPELVNEFTGRCLMERPGEGHRQRDWASLLALQSPNQEYNVYI